MAIAEKIAGITFSGIVLAWLVTHPTEVGDIMTAFRKLAVGGVTTLQMR